MKNAIGVALLLLSATAFAEDEPLQRLQFFNALRESGRGPLLLRPAGVAPAIPAAPQQSVPRYHFTPPREYDRGSGKVLFIGPTDNTELRMETAAPDAKFKCPVDGTEMRRGIGPHGRIFLIE